MAPGLYRWTNVQGAIALTIAPARGYSPPPSEWT
jgi:hypothetical protein